MNYNRLQDTVKTAGHLKQLCCNRKDIEIIAIDNGSADGTADFLRSQSCWLDTLLLKDNIGIAALNRGFEQSRGEYILVLDDDSHPLNIDTIDLLIHSLNHNREIGIIACKIASEDGSEFQTWHIPGGDGDCLSDSIAFVGCGFAIRRDLFETIGWFPENYFLYQNEIYVAIETAKLGYKVCYDPRCVVVHRNSPVGRANWRQVFYPTRNSIWLLRQYAPFPMSLYCIFSRLCFGCIRAVESGELRWYLRAVREAFQYRVKRDSLPPLLSRKFITLWHQNSIVHQVKWLLSN